MTEYLMIGSSPGDEKCAQLGTPGYEELARAECQAFMDQLKRHYSAHHNGARLPCRLAIKGNLHDFGTYFDVQAMIPEGDEEASQAAYWLEANTPAEWDDEARKALRLATP